MAFPSPDDLMPGDPWVCTEHSPFLLDLFSEGLAQMIFGNLGASLLGGSVRSCIYSFMRSLQRSCEVGKVNIIYISFSDVETGA